MFEQEQGMEPAGQRQSKERADRGARSCPYWLSSTRNWNEMGESHLRWLLEPSNHFYIYNLFRIFFYISTKLPSKLYKTLYFNEVLVLLTIHKKDQESISAPYMDCLCKTGASSYSCFNQTEQDQESLSALSLNCLCWTPLTPWSGFFPVHRTIL